MNWLEWLKYCRIPFTYIIMNSHEYVMHIYMRIFCTYPDYYQEGFLAIQRALDLAVMKTLRPRSPVTEVGISMQRMLYPPYVQDPFIFAIQNQFPFLIMISFTIIAPNIAKDVILEKERRLKVL